MQRENLSIATAGTHFLYLPLYYAAHKDFFGLIPDRYRLEVDSHASRADSEALDQLLNETHESWGAVAYAVCDPTALLSLGSNASQAVILGGLITNTAFWAIDRRTRGLGTLADLGVFDRIVAFEPGTTGHRIAEHIRRAARKEIPIVEVEMGKELLALKQSETGTIALSPDLLEINELLTTNADFGIAFDLPSSPEYSNVLVTALLGRQDALTEYADLTRALVEALQRALVLVRYEDDDVIRYASGRFSKPEKRIRSALRRATNSHVFPPTLEISRAHWLNAARMSCEARGTPFDNQREREAVGLYDSHVSRPAREVRRVLATSLLGPLKDPINAGRAIRRWVSVAAMLGAFVTLSAMLLKDATAVAVSQFTVGAVTVGLLIPKLIRMSAKLVWAHRVSWLLLMATVILWMAEMITGTHLAGAAPVLIGAEVSIVLAALSSRP